MKVIFNADDFGLSKGVNLGIIEAHKEGVVRSTTLMAGMDAFDHAVAIAKENPELKVGVHLTLTAGKSIGDGYQTITDEQGNFLSLQMLINKIKEIDLNEVEKEYEAQIQKILSAGIEMDHFDSHHHTHNLDGITDIYFKLAKKYHKKVRFMKKEFLAGDNSDIITTDNFSENFYNKKVTLEHLKQLLLEQKGHSLEIMCHPAYVDYTLNQRSSYVIKRAFELHILTSTELKEFITRNNITICSFSDL